MKFFIYYLDPTPLKNFGFFLFVLSNKTNYGAVDIVNSLCSFLDRSKIPI